MTLKALGKRDFNLYTIDPHDNYEFGGKLNTYPILKENLYRNKIDEYVHIIKAKSTEVSWEKPIALLFIDGLHDYESVKSDFLHFKKFIIRGGIAAFHDYFPLCPDVKKFVDEVLLTNEFQFIAHRDWLIILNKVKDS